MLPPMGQAVAAIAARSAKRVLCFVAWPITAFHYARPRLGVAAHFDSSNVHLLIDRTDGDT